jgi:hypothetical protein
MKPVRLLKSMPPTMRTWLVTLRTKPAASYLPLAKAVAHAQAAFGQRLAGELKPLRTGRS